MRGGILEDAGPGEDLGFEGRFIKVRAGEESGGFRVGEFGVLDFDVL